MMIEKESLAKTLDAVNDINFYGKPLSDADRKRTAKWIAGRQGIPKSYADMFAPTKQDFEEGIRLFTGEKVTSGAATGHILGEEGCRALHLLEVKEEGVQTALRRASEGMLKRLVQSEEEGRKPGMF